MGAHQYMWFSNSVVDFFIFLVNSHRSLCDPLKSIILDFFWTVTIIISSLFVSLFSQFLTYVFFVFVFLWVLCYCVLSDYQLLLNHLSVLYKYLIINCWFVVLWIMSVKITMFKNCIICINDVVYKINIISIWFVDYG